jgi:hypothetical protein
MRWNWLEAQPGDHRTARKRRRMSKQERRQQRLKAEDERQRLEKIRTPRHPHDHMSFPGAGTLIVQLLIWEPWRECESWDIRLLPDSTIAAFYSKSESDSSWLLTGFERVPIDSSELQRFIAQLSEMRTALVCPPEPIAVVADGTSCEIAMVGGVQTSCRLAWSDGHNPPEWDRVVSAHRSMISKLRTLQPDPGTV